MGSTGTNNIGLDGKYLSSIIVPIIVEPPTGSSDIVCADSDSTARYLSVGPAGDSSGSGAGIGRLYKYRSDWKLPSVTLYVLS